MQSTCYFDPTQGQIANMTVEKQPSDYRLPHLPNLFGSFFVLIIMCACAALLLCMCFNKQNVIIVNENVTHQEEIG